MWLIGIISIAQISPNRMLKDYEKSTAISGLGFLRTVPAISILSEIMRQC